MPKALDDIHNPCMEFSSHSKCIVFFLTSVQISQFLECLSPSSLCGKLVISKELGPTPPLHDTSLELPGQCPLLSISEHLVNAILTITFSTVYHNYVLPCLSCTFIYWFNKHLLSSHSVPITELMAKPKNRKVESLCLRHLWFNYWYGGKIYVWTS